MARATRSPASHEPRAPAHAFFSLTAQANFFALYPAPCGGEVEALIARYLLPWILTVVPAEVETGPAPPGARAEPCGPPVPGMSCIPGGYFIRGSPRGRGAPDEHPQMRIWVDTFYMDVTEVTSGAYDDCVERRLCTESTPFYKDFSRRGQPMVGMSWYQAVAFCGAHGKHLPTEAEWEKAARGTDGRRFPWGDDWIDCDKAVFKHYSKGRGCGLPTILPGVGRTAVVGTKPPNQYGLYDMAGNAWEWVYDWYEPYGKCTEPHCRGPNPRGPCDGAEDCKAVRHRRWRVVKGGSWYWDGMRARSAYRIQHIPTNDPQHHYGFRCAASLAEARALAGAARRH